MRQRSRIVSFWLLLVPSLLVWLPSPAEGLTVNERSIMSLAGHLEVFRDSTGSMDLDAARQAPFTALPGALSAGHTRDALWLRFELARAADIEAEWWLIAQPTFIDDLRLFVPDAEGGYRERRAGDHVPVAERETRFRETVFKLTLDETPQTYYLRVQSSSTLTLTLALAPPDLYGQRASLENLFLGLFFGMILIAVLISALSAFLLRELFFFIATGYLLAYGFMRFTLVGFDQLLLYPDNPAAADNVLGVAICVLTSFYIWFFITYVEPGRRYPRLTRFYGWAAWVALAAAIYSAAGYYYHVAGPLARFHVITLPVLLLMAVGMLRIDRRRAMLYLLIFGPGALAALAQVVRNLGFLPVNFFTTNLLDVALIIQMPFAAIAVLMRVWDSQQAHLAAKSRALEAAHRLEHELEHKVAARTAELARSNAALVEREGDLIDAKRRAEELLASEQARQETQKSFIRMIAHELRTPLSIISIGVTNLRARTEPLLPDLEPRYHRIEGAISRLNALVDNALAEDRLGTSDLDMRPQLLRPSELVAQLCDQLVLTEKHPLRLALPEDDSPFRADACWLGLAVLNLIDNAAKYSPEGGPIDLTLEHNHEGLLIRVADRGIGFRETELPALFDKFYRTPGAISSGANGMGLGLFLVRQIVTLHGGTVTAESSAGKGSQFTIHLPSAA